MSAIRIHVLIPSMNCGPWIDRCLGSVHRQTHPPAGVLLVDDASSDTGYGEVAMDLCRTYGFRYFRPGAHRGCPWNVWLGVHLLDAGPEDVVFRLDGDDFLPHENVLARIAEVYADPEVWMTYGNYEPFPENTGQTRASAFPKEIIEARSFRAFRENRFNHPMTFRRWLWDGMGREDFQRADGQWFDAASDLLAVIPLLEMSAPSHFRFLDETLYGYNAVNPLSECSVRAEAAKEVLDMFNRPVKPQAAR